MADSQQQQYSDLPPGASLTPQVRKGGGAATAQYSDLPPGASLTSTSSLLNKQTTATGDVVPTSQAATPTRGPLQSDGGLLTPLQSGNQLLTGFTNMVLPPGQEATDVQGALRKHLDAPPTKWDEQNPGKSFLSKFASGALADTGDVAASSTSPAALGLAATGPLSKVAPLAGRIVGGGAGTVMGVGGVANMADAATDTSMSDIDRVQKFLFGGAQAAGGAAGAVGALTSRPAPTISRQASTDALFRATNPAPTDAPGFKANVAADHDLHIDWAKKNGIDKAALAAKTPGQALEITAQGPEGARQNLSYFKNVLQPNQDVLAPTTNFNGYGGATSGYNQATIGQLSNRLTEINGELYPKFQKGGAESAASGAALNAERSGALKAEAAGISDTINKTLSRVTGIPVEQLATQRAQYGRLGDIADTIRSRAFELQRAENTAGNQRATLADAGPDMEHPLGGVQRLAAKVPLQRDPIFQGLRKMYGYEPQPAPPLSGTPPVAPPPRIKDGVYDYIQPTSGRPGTQSPLPPELRAMLTGAEDAAAPVQAKLAARQQTNAQTKQNIAQQRSQILASHGAPSEGVSSTPALPPEVLRMLQQAESQPPSPSGRPLTVRAQRAQEARGAADSNARGASAPPPNVTQHEPLAPNTLSRSAGSISLPSGAGTLNRPPLQLPPGPTPPQLPQSGTPIALPPSSISQLMQYIEGGARPAPRTDLPIASVPSHTGAMRRVPLSTSTAPVVQSSSVPSVTQTLASAPIQLVHPDGTLGTVPGYMLKDYLAKGYKLPEKGQ